MENVMHPRYVGPAHSSFDGKPISKIRVERRRQKKRRSSREFDAKPPVYQVLKVLNRVSRATDMLLFPDSRIFEPQEGDLMAARDAKSMVSHISSPDIVLELISQKLAKERGVPAQKAIDDAIADTVATAMDSASGVTANRWGTEMILNLRGAKTGQYPHVAPKKGQVKDEPRDDEDDGVVRFDRGSGVEEVDIDDLANYDEKGNRIK